MNTTIPIHLPAKHYKILTERRIFIHVLELEVDILQHSFIINAFSFALVLKQKSNAIFSNEEDEIFITLSSLKINIQTGEELIVLHEICIKKVYNFVPAKKAIVFDIGMNVGITSLLFSLQERIVQIVGFEPFYETFIQAHKNFSLNGKMAGKIKAHNFGLGKQRKTLELDYVKEFKANMSTTYTPTIPSGCTVQKVRVEIHDVKEIVEPILNLHNDLFKILKIDCEGAEYEIMERLDESGLLKQIDAVLLEWHYKGPLQLVDVLRNNDFSILSFDCENSHNGMIYGLRL